MSGEQPVGIGPVHFRANARRVTDEQTVERFTIRARIVQDHSLAGDKDQLRKLARHTFSFRVVVDDGSPRYELVPFTFPPTEQVESAAARVRPIFLKGDGVWYEDVLAAIYRQALVPEDLAEIEQFRDAFRVADPDFPESYKDKKHRVGEPVNNNQIAGAWLYGHLLHDDERRRTFTSSTPLESTFYTASCAVAAMMLATVETLHLIERLAVRGVLDVGDDIFAAPVTVSATEWAPRGEVTVYSAPVGTQAPTDPAVDLESEGFTRCDPRDA